MTRAPHPPAVTVAVEGVTDAAVLAKRLNRFGIPLGASYGGRGKPHLLSQLSGYNKSAARQPWIVLVDLNSSFECAPLALESWLPERASGMMLRIAVRQVESWLLADAGTIADFLHVPKALVPADPDGLPNAKLKLVDVARRSRSNAIKRDFLPSRGSGRDVGARYTSRIVEFTRERWNPERAAARSESPRRCIDRLTALVLELRL